MYLLKKQGRLLRQTAMSTITSLLWKSTTLKISSFYKVFLLKDFTDTPGDIDDPWFTRQFDVTYNEVLEGCRCFLKTLNKEGKITLNDEQLKIIDEDL